METQFSAVTVTYSARGIPTYLVEVSHEGLHKYLVLRAGDPDILAHKVLAQAQRWNTEWAKQSAADLRIRQTYAKREKRRLQIEHQKEIALERTTEAQRILEALQTTLTANIELDPALDWEQLKVRAPFSAGAPNKPKPAPEPAAKPAPPAPERSDFKYRVAFSFLDRLVRSRKQTKLVAAQNRFDADVAEWHDACAALSAEHQAELDLHLTTRNSLQEEYSLAMAKWEA
jgi:restriction system protein